MRNKRKFLVNGPSKHTNILKILPKYLKKIFKYCYNINVLNIYIVAILPKCVFYNNIISIIYHHNIAQFILLQYLRQYFKYHHNIVSLYFDNISAIFYNVATILFCLYFINISKYLFSK